MTQLVIPNKAKETTITTGTGTLALGGATDADHVTLVNGGGNGNTMPIYITDGAGNWEACWSQVASGTPDTATRGLLIDSSTGGRINFDAGIKTVTIVPLQQLLLWVGKSDALAETVVASATTTDIGAATTFRVQITGTTTITGFGTQQNALRIVRFAGRLTLTYNAASLILGGGANRVTAVGDVGMYISDGSGNWREILYHRAAARNVYKNFSESAPNATSSATPVQKGLGSDWTLTPTSSGTVKIKVSGWCTCTSFPGNVILNGSYGTGSAPADGAAATGTAFFANNYLVTISASGNPAIPFAFETEVSGLTQGTAYWFDLRLGTSGTTAAVRVLSVIIEEVP